jgi:hypothetical protein
VNGSRSTNVTSELVETLTHSCPHCRALLDVAARGWDGWVRCSSCGRLFLPPEFGVLPHAAGGPGVSGLANGAPTAALGPADFQHPEPLGRMAHTSVARVVFTTGFVLSLLLTLIKFLDFSPAPMAIFGFMTIVFFLLLLRTPRKRVPLPGALWARQEIQAAADHDASPKSSP